MPRHAGDFGEKRQKISDVSWFLMTSQIHLWPSPRAKEKSRRTVPFSMTKLSTCHFFSGGKRMLLGPPLFASWPYKGQHAGQKATRHEGSKDTSRSIPVVEGS